MGKKRKPKNKKPIPLVKGVTASSLAKNNKGSLQLLSRNQRRRKCKREEKNSNSTTQHGEKEKHQEQQQLFSSTAESLAVISKFHTLNKRLEQIKRDTTLSAPELQRMIQTIQEEQDALGGLERYQKASIYGAQSSKFVCADWVVPMLQKKFLSKNTKGKGRRLRILDVGAIDNQYRSLEWLDAVPIDLHGGQHESVIQVDFFDYAHEYCCGNDLSKSSNNSKQEVSAAAAPPPPFDAIVLSLVLNFQGDPRNRGDMLALAADPRILKEGGLVYVALPAASLQNSRYCDVPRFVEVAATLGLEVFEEKTSSKLVLLAFCKQTTKGTTKQPHFIYATASKMFDYGEYEMKRLPAKAGTKRNNFAIILKSSQNRIK